MGRRRWNITTQERKVCDVEIEIISFKWYKCEALGKSNQDFEIVSEDNANENL